MARSKKRRRKRVPVALIISVLVHGFLILIFIYFAKTQLMAPSKNGVISMDFIEAVHHQASAPSFRTKPILSPGERQTSLVPTGDPAVEAQETDSYLRTVYEIVGRRKTYPRESIEREEEGRVILGVSVAADGKVLDVRVEEASPFQRLNNAAQKSVSEIGGFPPLPTSVEAPMHLHIPLQYRLETSP